MRVDGIIVSISESTRDLETFIWIAKTGIPLLFLDRQPDPPLPGFSSVLVDDKGGAFKAIEHAILLGYRDIACIGAAPHQHREEPPCGLQECHEETWHPCARTVDHQRRV